MPREKCLIGHDTVTFSCVNNRESHYLCGVGGYNFATKCHGKFGDIFIRLSSGQ